MAVFQNHGQKHPSALDAPQLMRDTGIKKQKLVGSKVVGLRFSPYLEMPRNDVNDRLSVNCISLEKGSFFEDEYCDGCRAEPIQRFLYVPATHHALVWQVGKCLLKVNTPLIACEPLARWNAETVLGIAHTIARFLNSLRRGISWPAAGCLV